MIEISIILPEDVMRYLDEDPYIGDNYAHASLTQQVYCDANQKMAKGTRGVETGNKAG